MADTPYASDKPEQLILRDRLAIDRTVLANERTLLAYLRTALTFLVLGASFVKFFDSLALTVIGWAFVPVSLAVLLVGAWRYRTMGAIIRRAEGPGEGGRG